MATNKKNPDDNIKMAKEKSEFEKVKIKQRKCPKCGSKNISFNIGSTSFKPINNNYWGICAKCLNEWDTGITFLPAENLDKDICEMIEEARKGDVLLADEPANIFLNITQKISLLEARQKYLEAGLDKTYNEFQERTTLLAEALDKTLEHIGRLITIMEAIHKEVKLDEFLRGKKK